MSTNQDCQQTYGTVATITSNMVCAHDNAGTLTRDSCQVGDFPLNLYIVVVPAAATAAAAVVVVLVGVVAVVVEVVVVVVIVVVVL